MTCGELRELAAACALGALEPEELAEVERHLAAPGPHHGCRDAVDRARAAAAELAYVLPEVKPPPGARSALEVRIGRPRSRRTSRMGAVGWAAAAAAAVALVLSQVHRLDARSLRGDVAQARAAALAAAEERDRLRAALRSLEGAAALQREALALLDRPGTRLVPMAPQRGEAARAVAILDGGGRAVVTSTTMPSQPGKTYQLWVIRGASAPRPAGFMRATSDGTAAGEVDRALMRGRPPDALAVSLEPAGGSPTPTRILAVGKLAG